MAGSTLPGWEQFRQTLAELHDSGGVSEGSLLPILRAGRVLAVAAYDKGVDDTLEQAQQASVEGSSGGGL